MRPESLRPTSERFENEPRFRQNIMNEVLAAVDAGDLQLVKSILQQLNIRPPALTSDQLTAADNRMLENIAKTSQAGRTQKFADLMDEYYKDADRADRTPRKLLYFHIGCLISAVWSSAIKIGKVH